jgi:hypothetical protein
MTNRLCWLWRELPGVAWVLVIATGALFVSAPGFAASEIAALSTVHVAHAEHPAVIRLGPGTYYISQDFGDADFPDGATDVSVTGPDGLVPVRQIPSTLSLDSLASAFLGAWDCYRVGSFTIPQAASYQVSVKEGDGVSGAWISEPYADVVRQLFPWVCGVTAAAIAIAVCLIVAAARWSGMRRMARANDSRPFRGN